MGPDDLVADGVADALRRGSIAVVGPSREAAKIEWSKTFAKELMRETGVPTALWESFASAADARAALDRWHAPLVVKADGLAAGKGVTVCRTAENRFAVESARPFAAPELLLDEDASRLNRFAVLAFWAEITRLPVHWAPRFAPENATAQTLPSRSTRVAHMFRFKPLVSADTALTRADFSAA